MQMKQKLFAKFFDHTILKADATVDDVQRICREALEYGFASVCVNSCHAKLAADMLRGSGIKICCVVGFPLGAMSTKAKVFEAVAALEDGAEEIDMVINVGYLKSKAYDRVRKDIAAVARAVKDKGILKVIIETCLLEEAEKIKACELAVSAGADFVKTSTGFAGGGALAADVRLMRETVGPHMGVKASGGIRDLACAEEMIRVGANRIGASATVEIMKQLEAREKH